MDTGYRVLSETEYARYEHFRHFWDEAPCIISMCDEISIGELYAACQRAKKSFTAAVLFAVSSIINAHEEFRMLAVDSPEMPYLMPAVWNVVHPSYNVFHAESETYTNIFTLWDKDGRAFFERYESDTRRASSLRVMAVPGVPNTFEASCVPWRHFTSVGAMGDLSSLSPIVAWGKFRETGDGGYLPLSIQIHHAAADGFHLARFLCETETFCATLAKDIANDVHI